MLVSCEGRPSSKVFCHVFRCWSILAATFRRDLLLGNSKNLDSCGSSMSLEDWAASFSGQEESFLPRSGWRSLPQPKSPVWWVLCTLKTYKEASHIKEDFPKHSDKSKVSLWSPLWADTVTVMQEASSAAGQAGTSSAWGCSLLERNVQERAGRGHLGLRHFWGLGSSHPESV